MNSFYHRKDYDSVEKIIEKDKNGYSNSFYFPISTNLRVYRALQTGDIHLYDKALIDLAKMKAHIIDSSPVAYAQLLPYLKIHGLEPTFNNDGRTECDWNLRYLREAHENAIWMLEPWEIDGAFWYSLYVNSSCSTTESKAIYIDLLADIDLTKAESELHKLQATDSHKNFSSELIEALCGFRKKHTDYENSALSKLEGQGLVVCKEPYTGFWKD